MTLDEIKAIAAVPADQRSGWTCPLDGEAIDPKTIKAKRIREGQVSSFVARSTRRGRSWLAFLHKLEPSPPDRWWKTAHKTRREALGKV